MAAAGSAAGVSASPVPWGRRVFVFTLVAIVGLAADLISKAQVFAAHYRPGQPPQRVWLVPDVLGIETTTNPGALFGMFPGFHVAFSVLSVVVLLGIIGWLYLGEAARDRYLNFSLGLISGGILGNLYDRLGLGFRAEYPEAIKHHVRDWILFQWQGVRFLDPWPNFNIADSLLVCGAILLVFHSLFLVRSQPAESIPSSDSAA